MEARRSGRVFEYLLGDLSISSDLELGLPAADGNAGEPPDLIVRNAEEGWSMRNHSGSIRLAGGEYLLEGGIFYRPEPSASDRLITRDILDAVLPEYLSITGRTVLHCSVVDKGGDAVLFTGISGSGKSTTALALEAQGWRARADDFAIITSELEVETFGGPLRIRDDVYRALRPVAGDERARGKSIVERPWRSITTGIGAVAILEQGNEVLSEEIPGAEAFDQLIRGCFRRSQEEQLLKDQIDVMAKLVDLRPVVRLFVPRRLEDLTGVAGQLSSLLDRFVR